MSLKTIRTISERPVGLQEIKTAIRTFSVKPRREIAVREKEEREYFAEVEKEQKELEEGYKKYSDILSGVSDIAEYGEKFSTVPERYREFFYTPEEVSTRISEKKESEKQSLLKKVESYRKKSDTYKKARMEAKTSEQFQRYSALQQYYEDMAYEVEHGLRLLGQGYDYTSESIVERASSIADKNYAQTQLRRAEYLRDKDMIQIAKEVLVDEKRKTVPKQFKAYGDPLGATKLLKSVRMDLSKDDEKARQEQVRQREEQLYYQRYGLPKNTFSEYFKLPTTTKKKEYAESLLKSKASDSNKALGEFTFGKIFNNKKKGWI